MRHEHVPMTTNQRRDEMTRFFRVVMPEIRPTAARALGTMLKDGTLRQSSATRLFRDLWNTPGSYFNDTQDRWKARPVE